MLRLSELRAREWNLTVKTVIFDQSKTYRGKIEKMVLTARYQGFDPAMDANA